MPTTLSDFSKLSRKVRESAQLAKEAAEETEMLVVCIHPEVEEFVRDESGVPDGSTLNGVGGIEKVMVTESVPGYCVLICDENL